MPLLEPLTCTWYLCIFVNSLDLKSSLRVWDCFLHEGRKVLLRIGLTVLYNCQDELLNCGDLCAVYEVLRNNRCVRSATNKPAGSRAAQVPMISSDELIAMSYDKSWIGSFPHNRIDELRDGHVERVRVEVAEIEKRRREREEKQRKRDSAMKKEMEMLKREERLENVARIAKANEY